MYWLAFTTGIIGSLHCLGMCGPIALGLPGNTQNKAVFIWQRLQYNIGRVFTYGVLGAVMGLPGQWINTGHWQQGLSIAAGAALLLWFFAGLFQKKNNLFGGFYSRVAIGLQKAFARTGIWQWLSIGVINGLLPCGLVYVALAGAFASGGLLQAMLFMLFFGLGTIPMMLAIGLSTAFTGIKFRSKLKRVLPATTLVVGLLLIVRGLNLGIPYISPQLKQQADGKAQMECCDPKSDKKMK